MSLEYREDDAYKGRLDFALWRRLTQSVPRSPMCA